MATDKKTKRKKNKRNTKKLWTQFDEEISPNTQNLECLYRDSKISEKNYCDLCNEKLSISNIGFLVCSNKQCAIVYKDVLEQGAEWRYYGADDNNMRDPTRCGMPINPLLKES